MEHAATEQELAAGRGYEALFVPALFKPWTRHLIAGARIADGADVLDVACGSGVLARDARQAAGPDARVVGLDPAPGMIAAAAELAPDIDWMLGTAEQVGFPDGSFDAVVSQFGMMFFQDKPGAAAEMLRVLKPGGRLAVAVWNSIDHNPAYGDIIAVLDEDVSEEAGNALRLPFTLGDAGAVAEIFALAGFENVTVETRSEVARFPGSRTMVEAELRGWLPLFGINLDEETIADVLVKSDKRLSQYTTPSGDAVFPTSGHVLTARKPA